MATWQEIADGDALWARTTSAGSNRSSFDGVTADSTGKVYVAGSQSGTSIYTYATGVDATATAGHATGFNPVILKYE